MRHNSKGKKYRNEIGLIVDFYKRRNLFNPDWLAMSKILFILPLLCLSLFASSQSVDFTFQASNGIFCNPATIQFTQKTTGNPVGYIWNLGNGLKSYVANPSTSYNSAGTYIVKLTAIYAEGSLDISKTITIAPAVTVNLTVDRDYICQPGAINLTATSSGKITNYAWDYGDGIKENNTTRTTTHTFSTYDSFRVILRVNDSLGCFARDTLKVFVKKTPIIAKMDTSAGCLPANVRFQSSVQLPLTGTVASYTWDFGDGTAPVTTQTNSVNYSYNTTDSVRPSLKVTTNEGCVDTVNFPAAAFGFTPGTMIAYPVKDTVCGSETPEFVAIAPNATGYTWNFGDGTTETVFDTIAKHKYTTLGLKKVTVTPLFNGCPGAPITFNIRVIGVIARFQFLNNCLEKQTFAFTNLSLGNKRIIQWAFGDGSPDVFTNNANHSFPIVGTFITQLTVTDTLTGCLDTFSRPIFTARPSLVNPDQSICINTVTNFTIADNYNNPAATYTWGLVGRQVDTRLVPKSTLTAQTVGNFDNYVIIRNGSGFCRDTIYLDHKILVRGPQLDFTLPTSSCFADSVLIVNNSRAFVPGDSIVKWEWNYGINASIDRVFQPAAFYYSAPRDFIVKLTAEDINGCKDDISKKITVNPLPFLRLIHTGDTLCVGQADTLIAFHSDPITWSPSAGLSCTTCDSVVARPTSTSYYYAVGTSPRNCSIRDSVLVSIQSAFTASPGISDQYICPGEQVTLDVNPKDKKVTWTSSTGSTDINVYNPVVKPTQTTVYTATLQDSSGCSVPTSTVITVFLNPLPTVEAGPDQHILINTPFTIAPVYGSNIASYLWTPAMGLTCTSCANTGGISLQAQAYKITVTSDSGCIASDSLTITIKELNPVISLPNAFTPNNDNLNDVYYPIARGVTLIARFSIYNREGALIYEARNFTPAASRSLAWTGEYKGSKLPPRAYLYLVEAVGEQGQKVTKAGSVVLIR
ncbi:MAG: PKD domain-containing protein [Ferruginibacter sp.]|nr:PKD domain-containing protein [Ferruginibacter sp.]